MLMSRFTNKCKNKIGSKVSCFAGFCHHSVMKTGVHMNSIHMHMFHDPLFESETKTALLTIA